MSTTLSHSLINSVDFSSTLWNGQEVSSEETSTFASYPDNFTATFTATSWVPLGESTFLPDTSIFISPVRVAHINTTSLLPKFNDVADIIHLDDLDILAISESWVQPNIPASAIVIRRYNVICADQRK